jgi:hypothetical protein
MQFSGCGAGGRVAGGPRRDLSNHAIMRTLTTYNMLFVFETHTLLVYIPAANLRPRQSDQLLKPCSGDNPSHVFLIMMPDDAASWLVRLLIYSTTSHINSIIYLKFFLLHTYDG